MKVAIVHDWLTVYAGAEKVLEQLLVCYPSADVFSTVDFLSVKDRKFLEGRQVYTTFIQQLPFAKKYYRNYLPLMPIAVEQLDLSEYDLVLSSSYAVAKGVITSPHQLHVSYVHSPIRYAWDLQFQYLKEAGLDRGIRSAFIRMALHYIRIWDQRTINGVDSMVANSRFIAKRIWKHYKRTSEVIYPPVSVDLFQFQENKEDFYLTVSRLVPYKKVSLIVEAFSHMPNKRLVVIGDGPEAESVRRVAKKNVEILGYQASEVVIDYMRRARAFIFAAEEDFGIVPVEAQAAGTPVIAFGRGGVRESVIDLCDERPTGVFFEIQSVEAIADAVKRFENQGHLISPFNCRESALRFRPEAFRGNFVKHVKGLYDSE